MTTLRVPICEACLPMVDIGRRVQNEPQQDAERLDKLIAEAERYIEDYRQWAPPHAALIRRLLAALRSRSDTEQRLREAEELADALYRDRYDLLSAKTTEGMSAAEWQMRTATAERRAREAEDTEQRLMEILRVAQSELYLAAEHAESTGAQYVAENKRKVAERIRRALATDSTGGNDA